MLNSRILLITLLLVALSAWLQPASASAQTSQTQPASQKGKPMSHAVVWFEIPVTNMKRAITFYETILGIKLERQKIDGYEMAMFPFTDGAPGASGALAKGDVYKPSKTGPIVYFSVKDLDATLATAHQLKARVLYAKKDIGAAGFVAEIQDSEGNRMALLQPKP
jgi:uncharacterized protein